MSANLKSLVLLLLTSLLLVGCGFHLRGQGFDLQGKKVWLLSQNKHADFERTLKQRLLTQGASLVDDVSLSQLQLAIDSYQLEERVVARDGQGRPSELELIYQLNYRLIKTRLITGSSVLTSETEDLTAISTLSSRREFAFNRNLSTGQDQERQRLLNDMQQEIISRLLLQMAKH